MIAYWAVLGPLRLHALLRELGTTQLLMAGNWQEKRGNPLTTEEFGLLSPGECHDQGQGAGHENQAQQVKVSSSSTPQKADHWYFKVL